MTPGLGRYEQRDVAFRPLVVAAIALAALVVATFGLMRVLDRALVARQARLSPPPSPLAATYGLQEPPAPRLQVDPRRDLLELRAREQAQLEGYGWVDRPAGRVRIPVARAAELLAQESR